MVAPRSPFHQPPISTEQPRAPCPPACQKASCWSIHAHPTSSPNSIHSRARLPLDHPGPRPQGPGKGLPTTSRALVRGGTGKSMQKSTYHAEIYSQLHFDTVPKVPNYAAQISPCSSFR